MAGSDKNQTIEDMVKSAGGGLLRAVRLGPGAIGNLAIVAVSAFISTAVLGWALSSQPLLAGAAVLLVILFALYFVERCFRFAERHPAEALMRGSEYFHYLRDQSAAKDKSIVIEGELVGARPAVEDRSGPSA